MSDFRELSPLPFSLLPFSESTLFDFRVAMRVMEIARHERQSAAWCGRRKKDLTLFSNSDIEGQRIGMKMILDRYPWAKFIAEESMSEWPDLEKRRLTGNEGSGVISLETSWCMDAVDSSQELTLGLHGWATQLGRMRYGIPENGIVVVPGEDGLVAIAETGSGMWFRDGCMTEYRKGCVLALDENRKPFVGFGLPIVTQRAYADFWHRLCEEATVQPIVGTARGLALVACGKLHAYVNSMHPVYDWLPGWKLVKEAGGVVQFFRIEDDRIKFLEGPDALSYNPSVPTTGYIAGDVVTVRKLKLWLLEHMPKAAMKAAAGC